MAASQEKSMPFIKNLASSDRKTRTASLTSLRTFLSAKHISAGLSLLDALKLWKGLFYALWMCDRPLPQQALCDDLAALIRVLPDEAAVALWLKAFWATMAREWTTGIDVLRMEKFLLLVRRVLGASLEWTRATATATQQKRRTTRRSKGKKRAADGEVIGDETNNDSASSSSSSSPPRWDARRVQQMLGLLADWPLRPDEESRVEAGEEGLMPRMVPVGLKLHVLDIWVDEADKVGMLVANDGAAEGEEADGALSGYEVLRRINELVETLNRETTSPAVRKRSREALDDERLPWNEGKGEQEDKGSDEESGIEWGGLDD